MKVSENGYRHLVTRGQTAAFIAYLRENCSAAPAVWLSKANRWFCLEFGGRARAELCWLKAGDVSLSSMSLRGAEGDGAHTSLRSLIAE